MTQFTPEIANLLLDACRAGASEASASISNALDAAVSIVNVEARPAVSATALGSELHGPGLALVFHLGEQAGALIVPEDTQLLPAWYTTPDPTGQARLQTLAQELSLLLLPSDMICSKFSAGAMVDMSAAIGRSGPADLCGRLALTAKRRDGETTLHFIWPLRRGDQLIDDQAGDASAARAPSPPSESEAYLDESLARLPNYSRSLLCINVPVVVTLAQTKRKVSDVIKLGPGAIIQFEKSCEDTLELEAGGQRIAEGEAVKVGEKFGLRITAIRLPEERFRAVGS